MCRDRVNSAPSWCRVAERVNNEEWSTSTPSTRSSGDILTPMDPCLQSNTEHWPRLIVNRRLPTCCCIYIGQNPDGYRNSIKYFAQFLNSWNSFVSLFLSFSYLFFANSQLCHQISINNSLGYFDIIIPSFPFTSIRNVNNDAKLLHCIYISTNHHHS